MQAERRHSVSINGTLGQTGPVGQDLVKELFSLQQVRPIHNIKHQTDLQRVRDEDPNFSGTLAKGLMILQCFVKNPRAHANSEFAQRLGLPRSTVSRLCRSLQALGFLDHDARLDRYFIGPAAVTLGYPYIINAPMLAQLRPLLQSMADRFEGAVSVGVVMDMDVVFIETCAHEQGTLARPGVGAIRSIVETSMGRAWLSVLEPAERAAFLSRVKQARPEEYALSIEGAKESIAHYAKRHFAINLGDGGMGVLAAGVASDIQYGSRRLLFNCATPGYKTKPAEVLKTIGPALSQLVRAAARQAG